MMQGYVIRQNPILWCWLRFTFQVPTRLWNQEDQFAWRICSTCSQEYFHRYEIIPNFRLWKQYVFQKKKWHRFRDRSARSSSLEREREREPNLHDAFTPRALSKYSFPTQNFHLYEIWNLFCAWKRQVFFFKFSDITSILSARSSSSLERERERKRANLALSKKRKSIDKTGLSLFAYMLSRRRNVRYLDDICSAGCVQSRSTRTTDWNLNPVQAENDMTGEVAGWLADWLTTYYVGAIILLYAIRRREGRREEKSILSLGQPSSIFGVVFSLE